MFTNNFKRNNGETNANAIKQELAEQHWPCFNTLKILNISGSSSKSSF
jgi:hypothetical protein